MTAPSRTDHAQQLRRALLAIEKAEARIEELERREAARREPIAVVGVGCRFPGAATPGELWANLIGGVDCIREVPPDRWDVAALFDPDPDAPGKMITRRGGFVDGIDQFDPAFFGVSPREAARMDPQQRLALEVAWEALEDAAIVPAELAGGAVGVFMGACSSNHGLRLGADLAAIDAHSATGAALSIIANRISYLLNFRGPSLVVDTACSSSLVAIHLACQSLRAGECDVALAGGVNAILAPHEMVFFSRVRALAADGRCKAFDARADGFVRGEGCGVVVLERVSDARAAGHRVLALVRGSAVNQDGTTSGLTAPSGLSQQAMIRRALDSAGVAPGRIGYVEAHGTGTALGDPIEVEALAQVLGAPSEVATLWLGAVKTNIGHLEGGAGVAGFVKAVLALHHSVIPPNLHFQNLNPRISVIGTRLGFPTRPIAWPAGAHGRFAGVSSFGFGGTNAHIVLEAAGAAPPDAPTISAAASARGAADAPASRPAAALPATAQVPAPVLVLPLSARSEAALAELARRFEAHLAAHPEQPLLDVCTTAAIGRSQFRHRVAFRADRAGELRRALAAFAAGSPSERTIVGPAPAPHRPRVAFLFTGQGSQYANMGRGLYGWNAVFRAAIDECAERLRPHLDLPLHAILFPAPGDAAGGTAQPTTESAPQRGIPGAPRTAPRDAIDETIYTQPALFALEYALVQLWRSWGVVPDAVIGHGLGELVAAHVAGVLSLGDALALVAARGQLVQTQARRGAMAVVRATEAEMTERLAPYGDALSLAAIDAPESLLIAGDEAAVAELVDRMTAESRDARRLPTSNAFHSPLVEPALDAFEACAARVAMTPPALPMFSNVTGARGVAELAVASYWRRQLRAPVLFRAGLEALRAHGATVLVEIGPHTTLLGLAAETLGVADLALVPSLRRRGDDREQVLDALARLWTHGVAVDWAGAHRASPGRRVSLPTAPFERRRYWYETTPAWCAGPSSSWFYRIEWKPCPHAAATAAQPSVESTAAQPVAGPGVWLIIGGDPGLGPALARELEASGAQTVRTHHGDHFTQRGPDDIALDAEQPGHVQRLFDVLHDAPLRGVVVLALEELDRDRRAGGIVERSLERAHHIIASALHIAQAAARRAQNPALWLITRGAQPAGTGHIDPVQAPLWGLGRTLQHEHPELACRLVDLDPELAPSRLAPPQLDAAQLAPISPDATRIVGAGEAPALAAALLRAGTEDQLALRGGRWLAARLVRETVPSAPSPAVPRAGLRSNATWLITGGLGALGLQIARWLVGGGVRGLILFGRSAPGDAARAAIAELERGGATVVVARGDVARHGDVARALDLAGSTRHAGAPASQSQVSHAGDAAAALGDGAALPPLAGVVHAAGILDDGALSQLTAERFARVMSPKLAGAAHLDALTRDLPLEAFVMFSSVASLLGAPGQANYAAGNAFLDALAHRRRALHLPALSINWGPWAEVGMWATLGARPRARRGVGLIPPARGVDALAALLGGDAAQVAIVPIDWPAFSAQFPAGRAPRLLTELVHAGGCCEVTPDPHGAVRARFLAAAAAARPAIVRAFLVEKIAAAMRAEPQELPSDRNLVELGMDSLMVVEVVDDLEREFHLTLYPRELYEHPSIAALSGYLATEIERAHTLRAIPTMPASASAPASPTPARRRLAPTQRIPGIAFVLSSPRAGSTLLRVMLAGHPALFCPPELHLLGHDTLREREHALGASYLGEGLPRAVMELERLDAQGVQRRMAAWLHEDLAIRAVYARLQALAAPRLLVDKSPTYGGKLETLEHAEQLFDGARYVFLFRHPYAVIESFVRKRMTRLLGDGHGDAHMHAEQVWLTSNHNTLAFLQRIPGDRAHRIRYEDLVREPERVMRAACGFLQVPYHPAVLSPYAGDRMTDGVHPQSAAIGDPDFLAHTGVDSRLAETWRDVRLPRALGQAARRVAAELGYELPAEAADGASRRTTADRHGITAADPASASTETASPRARPTEASVAPPDPEPTAAPRDSFLEVRGLQLCVLSWGPDDGPTIVGLHGILDHAGAFAEIAERLVRRGLRVIAPDLRGHGRSGHVGAGGSYHLVDFVADVDALARTLGPAPFTLVGHSLGAAIAGLFAAARPGWLSSLVLVEAALPTGGRGTTAEQLSTHLDCLASAHSHPVFPDLAAAAERLRTIMAMPADRALAAVRRITEPCEGGVRWRWDPILRTRAGIAFHATELLPERFGELIGSVRCPVTWIYGDRSELRGACPDLSGGRTREIVLRGGHNVHLDSPIELAELIAATALPAG